ncbi:lysoplasmalogenase family protein [Flavobacterium azooxidireducens]|uniref:Lysoplasmalogenase family protein n=1 Tax=Flavobacterium azooxidireducens TaxID=1871076 RepID=A0ABY4KEZ8_9FLAO|nr:lysoplasmalogenase family protein [Flavobacterium azooxidireducens]UPQ79382.1 lysoplasmalogenase family protein [Flavobacterium azooxidireducens]
MNKVKILTGVLLIVALTEVIAEYFRFLPLIYIFKPLISIVLMLLYWHSSPKRDILFFLTIITSLITNVLFIPNDLKLIFIGLIVFGFHRLINIFYILKVMKTKDFIPVILASVPFLIIFFYIFFDTDLLSKEVYYIMIIHNSLISLLGGIALSHYIMNDSSRSSWLLICVLSFVTLHFIIFIEKFYIQLQIFRLIAMSLNAFAYYAFYRFILIIERSNSN